jgi:competence protein ComEC
LWLAHDPPDLLVDARGQLIGVRLEDGRLALAPFERDGWVQGGWLERYGQEEPAEWPALGEASAAGALRCDPQGCVLSRGGFRIALTRRPEALEEDCALADLVISYPRTERCPDGGHLIGPDALRAAQGLALWIDDGAIRTRSVRDSRGRRPWAAAGVNPYSAASASGGRPVQP